MDTLLLGEVGSGNSNLKGLRTRELLPVKRERACFVEEQSQRNCTGNRTKQQQRSQTPPPTPPCPRWRHRWGLGIPRGQAGFGDQLLEQMSSHWLLHPTHGKNPALPQPWGYHFTRTRTRLLTSIEPKDHLEICKKNLTLSKNKHVKILPSFFGYYFYCLH